MREHQPDAAFAEPRLAEVYDIVDGKRDDLDAYAAMAGELGVRHLLDVGCGTGALCCLLAARGIGVTGVDPALASLAEEVVTSLAAAGFTVDEVRDAPDRPGQEMVFLATSRPHGEHPNVTHAAGR